MSEVTVALKPLREQVIVITGASSGIGLVTAREAVKEGARVVVCSRNAEAVAQLERELSQGNTGPRRALGIACDVAHEDAVRRVADAAVETFGGFDTWVNNAGVSIYGLIEEVDRDDMRRLFETNFWGVVHGSLAALEHLKARGGGAIINVGSTLSERAIPLQGMYCASKFAVRGFTDALRMEVEKAGYPVSLTLIKPAAIDTPYIHHAKNYLETEPINPPPVYAPEVVASAILHCAAHPERDMFAGGAGAMFGLMEKVAPRPTDHYMEAMLFRQQKKEDEPARPRGDAALYEPSGPVLEERGGYEGKVFETSPYTAAKRNRGLVALGAGVGVGALLAVAAASRRDDGGGGDHGADALTAGGGSYRAGGRGAGPSAGR